MDILRMTYEAIEKQEMVNFLRGEKEYQSVQKIACVLEKLRRFLKKIE